MTSGKSSRGNAVSVGAALSADELCVVNRGGARGRSAVWRMPLQPLNGDGAGWPALTSALRELSRELGVDGGRLDVALMPPLTEIRRLDLPPMRDDDRRALLSRNATRYFVGARAPQLIGTSAAPPRATGPAGGVMAAAAPQRLVAALHAAARDAGWTVEAVSPAEGAWGAAAGALWPSTARLGSHVLVCGVDRTELLVLEHGRLSEVRRFRPGAADAALVVEAIRAAAGPDHGRVASPVAAVGADVQRTDLSRALAAAGVTVSRAPSEWAERAGHADLLAAEFAGPGALPLLRSEATLASRREQARRAIARMMGATIALVLLSATFSLWGAKRHLRAVQAERASIRPQLSATLVGRTSVETAFRQLAALTAAQRAATRWSSVIAGVSAHLDRDAYLTSLRGRDDTLLVEGIGARASKAFESLTGTPGLMGVQAAAPVRRESPEGGPAQERFTISAIIARAAAAGVPAAKGAR